MEPLEGLVCSRAVLVGEAALYRALYFLKNGMARSEVSWESLGLPFRTKYHCMLIHLHLLFS